MILKKECIAMFPALALIEIRQKSWIQWKTAFLLAFTETGSAPDIYWKLPYRRVLNLHYQRTTVRLNKATRS